MKNVVNNDLYKNNGWRASEKKVVGLHCCWAARYIQINKAPLSLRYNEMML